MTPQERAVLKAAKEWCLAGSTPLTVSTLAEYQAKSDRLVTAVGRLLKSEQIKRVGTKKARKR